MGYKSIEWRKVAQFLTIAVPLTALGAVGFAVVPKTLMTAILSVCLILFSIQKIRGRINLPKSHATMYIGGGITGFINGLLGISGPLSSAVFLTLELSPVAYIASEATAAAVMHIVKIVVYGKLALINTEIFLNGLYIGLAMVAGNFISLKVIKNINKKRYQKIVAVVMILASLWLLITQIKLAAF